MTTVPAKIYVNGRRVGEGHEAEIRKRGVPGSARVEAVAADGRRATQTIRRRFTFTTLLIGAVTYYTGWLLAWEYPNAVLVVLPERTGGWDSTWDSPAGDVWMQPPPGWAPPHRPTTVDSARVPEDPWMQMK
ncbi:MAG: hypothetical protein ABIL09_22745 [Gemmatimonadota bacterium]